MAVDRDAEHPLIYHRRVKDVLRSEGMVRKLLTDSPQVKTYSDKLLTTARRCY